MRKKLKKSIVLSIVPVFVLAACSNQTEEETRLAVPNHDSEVSVNADGSYRQVSNDHVSGGSDMGEADTKLIASYEQAVDEGYLGSFDDWLALANLYDTDPKAAEEKAQLYGYTGGEMLIGALMGAAIGAMAANALSGKANMSSSTYSAQRANMNQNYAYSRCNDDGMTRRGRHQANGLDQSCDNSSRSSYGSVSRGGFGGAKSSGG